MNLLSSTSVFGFYTLISRVLGYLRDILIAIFLGTTFMQMHFLLHLDYQIHLEDYLQKEHLMLHLFQVMRKKFKKEKRRKNIC